MIAVQLLHDSAHLDCDELVGRRRHGENLPDDGAHALLAHADARRALGDGAGWQGGFETIGQGAVSFMNSIRTKIEQQSLFGKKMLPFPLAGMQA